MPRWLIHEPQTLDFDGVVALRVRLMSGSVAVLGTQDRPCLDVAAVTGQALLVSHDAGILTVTYPDHTVEGLLGWLRPGQNSATITVTVPAGCPTQVVAVNANVFVGSIGATTSVRSVSGTITFDGVGGNIQASTVTGNVEAQGLAGRVGCRSLSGDLTLAMGSVESLTAKSVSGTVTADITPAHGGSVRIATVAGEVTVRLPGSADTRVDLRSTTGRVRSEFAGLTGTPPPGASALSGTVGGGSGRLSVTTMSGQVTLLERDPPGASPGSPQAEGDI